MTASAGLGSGRPPEVADNRSVEAEEKPRRPDPYATLAVATVVILGSVAVLERRGQDPRRQGQEPPRDVAVEELLPVDGSMFAVAAATGGDFYFWSPGEFAQSDLRLPLSGETILVAHGLLDGEQKQLDFPVDGLCGGVELFVGAQRLADVRVVRPGGATLRPDTAGVTWQTYERMQLISIDQPESGHWRLAVRGSGRFSVSARVTLGARPPYGDPRLEPVEVVAFDLVEVRGRPGHQGLFPLRGDPAPGARHTFELELSGSFDTAQVLCVSGAGAVLDKLDVDEVERRNGSTWATLRGSCTVPAEPFRISVRGFDATGSPYQRMCDGLIVPSVALETGPDLPDVEYDK